MKTDEYMFALAKDLETYFKKYDPESKEKDVSYIQTELAKAVNGNDDKGLKEMLDFLIEHLINEKEPIQEYITLSSLVGEHAPTSEVVEDIFKKVPYEKKLHEYLEEYKPELIREMEKENRYYVRKDFREETKPIIYASFKEGLHAYLSLGYMDCKTFGLYENNRENCWCMFDSVDGMYHMEVPLSKIRDSYEHKKKLLDVVKQENFYRKSEDALNNLKNEFLQDLSEDDPDWIRAYHSRFATITTPEFPENYIELEWSGDEAKKEIYINSKFIREKREKSVETSVSCKLNIEDIPKEWVLEESSFGRSLQEQIKLLNGSQMVSYGEHMEYSSWEHTQAIEKRGKDPFANRKGNVLSEKEFYQAYEKNTRDFSGMRFENVTFEHLRLDDINFENCYFKGCEFKDTDGKNVNLKNTVYENCRFYKADFLDSDFNRVQVTGESSCKFFNSTFERVDFSGSNLEKAEFYQCRFKAVEAEQTFFKETIFKECEIERSNFGRSVFEGAKWQEVSFTADDLSGIDLNRVEVRNVKLERILARDAKRIENIIFPVKDEQTLFYNELENGGCSILNIKENSEIQFIRKVISNDIAIYKEPQRPILEYMKNRGYELTKNREIEPIVKKLSSEILGKIETMQKDGFLMRICPNGQVFMDTAYLIKFTPKEIKEIESHYRWREMQKFNADPQITSIPASLQKKLYDMEETGAVLTIEKNGRVTLPIMQLTYYTDEEIKVLNSYYMNRNQSIQRERNMNRLSAGIEDLPDKLKQKFEIMNSKNVPVQIYPNGQVVIPNEQLHFFKKDELIFLNRFFGNKALKNIQEAETIKELPEKLLKKLQVIQEKYGKLTILKNGMTLFPRKALEAGEFTKEEISTVSAYNMKHEEIGKGIQFKQKLVLEGAVQ